MMLWKPQLLFGIVIVTAVVSGLTMAEDDLDFDDDEDMVGEDFDDIPPTTDDDDTDNVPAEPPKPIERPTYQKPAVSGNVFFTESFESDEEFKSRWVLSRAKKEGTDDSIAKYDGQWSIEEPEEVVLKGDLGLALKSRAKHHAVSAKLDKPVDFKSKTFVVQYEVKFQNGQECGGGYIKLLTQDSSLDLAKFHDKTPYTIMFGPDKCGNDFKLHFIFRHKNPLTGAFEEKHAKKPTATLEKYFTDKKTHLYTLVLHSDNSFEIYVDQDLINSGNLLTDMTPPVNPPKEISDPNDKKPADWDDRERVPDPDAVKPDDWDESEPEMISDESAEKPEGWLDDEPELIPDPNSEKPEDWDEDMDGEWEPPMINNPKCDSAPGCGEWEAPKIKNPKYKGKWSPPMIDNPSYKGKWSARMIPNPDFFEDNEPYKTMSPISALGLELWSMSDDILFDNFIFTDDKRVADDWTEQTWTIKHQQELIGSSSGRGVFDAVMDATHERPWLWVVFAVVVVLPIFMLIAYCCMSPSKTDETAERKKTDAPSESADDANDEETEDQTEPKPTSAGESTTVQRKKGAGKSQLNADVSPKKSSPKTSEDSKDQ
jgi:calnexin